MADENVNAAPAAANPTINRPASAPAPAQKNVARSPLITNPVSAAELEAQNSPRDETPSELPAGTIAEMEAGKKALERNKPVYARVAERQADVTPKEE